MGGSQDSGITQVTLSSGTLLKIGTEGAGRRSQDEIIQEVQARYNCHLVEGIAHVSELSKAHRNSGWVASFVDARCAYYIHQNCDESLSWYTALTPSNPSTPYIVFVFSVGMGYGSVLPQPSGSFDLFVNGSYKLSFCVKHEREVWESTNGVVRLAYVPKLAFSSPPHVPLWMDDYITSESHASYGLALLRIPVAMVPPGAPVNICVTSSSKEASRRWFKIDVDDWANIVFKGNLGDGLDIVTYGLDRRTQGDYAVYYGDIHAHSGETTDGVGTGCGTGSIDENYRYARYVSRLDFFCLTDHDFQIGSEGNWDYWCSKADQHNVDGEFAVLSGYEWTSLRHGHRNVYLRERTGPISFSGVTANHIGEDDPTPCDLWHALRAKRVRAITVPHHPCAGFFPMDWSYHDPQYERLVEIYSSWGCCEQPSPPAPEYSGDRHPDLSVQLPLRLGRHLGFVASSDAHDGHPGEAQWGKRQPHIRHQLGSGRVGVLTPSLNPEAVFDALYSRRCFATTGPRMGVLVQLNQHSLGDVVLVKTHEPVVLDITCWGTDMITRVEIMKNGALWKAIVECDQEMQIVVADNDAGDRSAFYYVRIWQRTGDMAWSSPIWVMRGE